ncbi:MAG: glycosyltransferase [Bacteroidota bacterium]
MKKLLIISYFYPPANFVGAQRTAAWAKYLHEYGYYPIIITRQWNEGQTDLVDPVKNNTLEVEKNQTHEVHRLPYKYSLRDRLANYPALKVFQKALTLKELVLSNYSIKQLPFSNFYAYSKKLIQKDSEIKIVIASGRPFQAFFIGYQLKKDFPRIHWVPDYRDEWSTRKTNKDQTSIHKRIAALEKSSEKKWVSNSTFFISVSEACIENIRNLVEKPGKLILNGHDQNNTVKTYENDAGQTKAVLKILYVGSIYQYQDFNRILTSVKDLNEKKETEINLTFLGSYANQSELEKLNKLIEGYEKFVELIPKVKQDEVMNYIHQSDLLFLTEYKNLKGCLPVKIFDYYNSDKPILLCPSDQDLMEDFIKETNSGYIANTVEECTAILEQLIQLKTEGKPLIGPRNEENAYFYSRKFQTKVLAKYLDELTQ